MRTLQSAGPTFGDVLSPGHGTDAEASVKQRVKLAVAQLEARANVEIGLLPFPSCAPSWTSTSMVHVVLHSSTVADA